MVRSILSVPFGTKRQSETVQISLIDYTNSIKYQTLKIKELIQSIRSCNDKNEKTRLKDKLPCSQINISYKENNSNFTLNGLLFLDVDNISDSIIKYNIDHNENYTVETMIEKFKNYGFVNVIYTSCSGKGIHIIISYNKYNLDYFASYKSIKNLTAYLNELYFFGMLDNACSNINRCTYTSYDENIFVKEENKVVPFSESISDFLESLNSFSNKEIKQYNNIAQTLNKNNVIINNDFLNDLKSLFYSEFLKKYKHLDTPNRSKILYDDNIDINSPYIVTPDYFFEINFPYEMILNEKTNKNIFVIKKIKVGKRNFIMFNRSLYRKRITPDITIEQLIYANVKDFYDHFERVDFTKSDIITISINAFISTYHQNIKKSNKKHVYNPFYIFNTDVENEVNGSSRRYVKMVLYNFNRKKQLNKSISKYYDTSLTIEQNMLNMIEKGIDVSLRKLKYWLKECKTGCNELYNKFVNNVNIIVSLVSQRRESILTHFALFNNSSNTNSNFFKSELPECKDLTPEEEQLLLSW